MPKRKPDRIKDDDGRIRAIWTSEQIPTIPVAHAQCNNCGERWVPRTPRPKACPTCKSRVWFRERAGEPIPPARFRRRTPDVEELGPDHLVKPLYRDRDVLPWLLAEDDDEDDAGDSEE